MSDRRWPGRFSKDRLGTAPTRATSARSARALTLLLVCFLLGVVTAEGQSAVPGDVATPPGASLEIVGRVLDADSREPLPGASVVLETISPQFAAGRAGGDRTSVVTDTSGDYRFDGLASATYRITVTRLGYVSAALEVDLRGGSGTRVSLGLEVEPIILTPLAVIGSVPDPYGRVEPRGAAAVGARMQAERIRQQRYLVADTRELTHAEVLEAITLAEADLFRALQRVPGVSTRDDYTAMMWTRGASWDQTRVFFDGLPLYNPTHAGWLFSAINPDAVGSASFHPGYRSAKWGEGAAAVLDIRSRSGRPAESLRGNAEISVASARLTLDGESRGGRVRWMVALRRSYVDLISGLARSLGGDEELYVPYDFSDGVARADLALGHGWSLQTSTILEYDYLRGDIPGLLRGNRGRWGNRAGQITLEGPAGPFWARMGGGGTNFSTLIFEEPTSQPRRDVTLPALENGIHHRLLSLELEPLRAAGPLRPWAVGIQALADSVSYHGPFSLLGAVISGEQGNLSETALVYGNALDHMALWGERRWALGRSFQALTGVRVEVGDSVHNGGTRRVAPRFAVRTEPSPGLSLTASWSRGFQYTQDVSPAAGPIGPQLHLSAIWVLASPARVFPAIRSDLATVGLERLWDSGWSLTANAYQRDATGLKIPNPVPGLVTATRNPDAEASNLGRGFEITGRRLEGRWTGSVGYAYGNSTMTLRARDPETADRRFPSSADVRHGLDAMGLVAISEALRIGGAFSFGSGVPFTRIVIGDDGSGGPPRLEEPNAERTPSYASLDAMVEYTTELRGWQVGGYLQLRNVANRNNSVTYSGSYDCSTPQTALRTADLGGLCTGRSGIADKFESGLPRLPLIGVRVAF